MTRLRASPAPPARGPWGVWLWACGVGLGGRARAWDNRNVLRPTCYVDETAWFDFSHREARSARREGAKRLELRLLSNFNKPKERVQITHIDA